MRTRLLAGFVLVAAIVLTSAPRNAAAAANSSFGTYNVQPTSFQVGWFTDQPVSGSVLVGTSCATATTAVGEQVPTDGYVHLSNVVSTVNGAAVTDSTTYYVKLVDNSVIDSNGGLCYWVTTVPNVSATSGSPVATGSVVYPNPGCSTGATGAFVTANVVTAQGNSWPLAAMTQSGGGYAIPLGQARYAATGAPLTIAPGNTIQLSAWATSSVHTSASTTYSPGTNMPTMCLASMPAQFGPTVTPTATPHPTSFVTSTPLPGGASTPTATAGPSPTPTGTIVLPTATSTATPIPTNTLIPFPTSGGPPVPPPPPPGGVIATSTPTPTPIPTATSTSIPPPALTAWTHITFKIIRPDGAQHIDVHTQRGVKVSMLVVYPDKLSRYSASGKAGKKGIWRRTWAIVTLQRGTAHVRLTLTLGPQKKVLNRHFQIG